MFSWGIRGIDRTCATLAGLTHHIIDALSTPGCGYTLDVHRGDADGAIVQWLWAEPILGADDSSALGKGHALSEAVKAAGIVSGDTAPYDAQLIDAVRLLSECPFQPAQCGGAHVVASGRGRLAIL